MTEIGHGSNVAAVETQAVYNHNEKCFYINSPTPTSAKCWIGALANSANRGVVFAQLIISGVSHGVHAFSIELRNRETH